MKRRLASLILFAIVSLILTHAPWARAEDDTGGAQDGQKAVKEIEAEEARVIIEEKKGSTEFVILDVRTAGEYSGGHIEGSTNIDVKSESFKEEVGKLDRSKTYLVHCRSGSRSETAVKIMEEIGFTDIYEMNGGILGWQDAGYPVTKD
ncbi:MAG: rhodanese-like domain-containing protein [Candidatus Dadabacteria bacterium]|nr:rhodanese-like domain-containing protein [Candidatus Dadabacteria bacterium]